MHDLEAYCRADSGVFTEIKSIISDPSKGIKFLMRDQESSFQIMIMVRKYLWRWSIKLLRIWRDRHRIIVLVVGGSIVRGVGGRVRRDVLDVGIFISFVGCNWKVVLI